MDKRFRGLHNLNAFIAADNERYITITAEVKEGDENIIKPVSIIPDDEDLKQLTLFVHHLMKKNGYSVPNVIFAVDRKKEGA